MTHDARRHCLHRHAPFHFAEIADGEIDAIVSVIGAAFAAEIFGACAGIDIDVVGDPAVLPEAAGYGKIQCNRLNIARRRTGKDTDRKDDKGKEAEESRRHQREDTAIDASSPSATSGPGGPACQELLTITWPP